MALVETAVFPMPRKFPNLQQAPDLDAGTTLDATAEWAGMVFTIPKSGTISKIHFVVSTVTTGDTLYAGLYTVSSGFPSSTGYGSMVAGTVAVSTTGLKVVTLGTPATVTMGDTVGVKIGYSAFVAGNLAILTVVGPSGAGQRSGVAYSVRNQGSNTKIAANIPIITLEYDDGTFAYIPGTLPAKSGASKTALGTTNGDELGIKITPALGVRTVGCYFMIAEAVSHDVYLYDGSNNVLASFSFVGGDIGTTTYIEILFSSAITLTSGATYRLVHSRAAISSSTFNVHYADCISAAAVKQLLGVTGYQKTSRPNAGSWTDVDGEVPYMGLLIDAVDTGSSGGMVIHPGMSGGIRA